LASLVTGIDFVAVPSTNWERSRAFYVDTLGLRPDPRSQGEFWVGETCFGIWEPATFGMEFAPQRNGHLALDVADVAAARAELEAKGVEFDGETLDTGVCHMAFFRDPDGNDLMLTTGTPHRGATRDHGRAPTSFRASRTSNSTFYREPSVSRLRKQAGPSSARREPVALPDRPDEHRTEFTGPHVVDQNSACPTSRP
jgi:catechol 2,3-dioxygenase-like lactoylglutathione lyase family enzyme